jgi:hypothetical protein
VLTLVLLLLLMTTITASTGMQLGQSASRQNSNHSNDIQEDSPANSTYWAKTYGGNGSRTQNFYTESGDWVRAVQQTSDGGYIVAGGTESFSAGISYSPYVWLFKLDSDGSSVWQKVGGFYMDDAYSVQQTSDGGYISAGRWSNPGPMYGPEHGYFILKVDSNGSNVWYRAYGVGDYPILGVPSSLRQTSDGGYVVLGYDGWVAKLNSTGGVTWQKRYNDSAVIGANSIQQTTDGGYIVAGCTNYSDSGWNAWVLKLDSSGLIDWQKAYGGSGGDFLNSIQQTVEGGYIVAGSTYSFGAGNGDVWVLRLDSTGGVTWQKTYGGKADDSASSIQQTSDGGYIVAGTTNSFGAGGTDFWFLKLDSTGLVEWQEAYGGSGSDSASSVEQTSDGGYIVAGSTNSFGAGGTDAWVVKLAVYGYIVWNASSGASTHTTSATPSNSNAEVSTMSTTPVDIPVTLGDSGWDGVEDIKIFPVIVKTQANGSVTEQEAIAALAVGEESVAVVVGVEAVAVIAVVVAGVLWEWNKSKKRRK